MRDVLARLELEGGESLAFSLAWLAGREVQHDPDELKAALRRAELLLAAGGDPRRELDLDGRAVTALADDLGTPEARDRLEDGLQALATEAAIDGERMASVASALAQLRAQPDLAWRCYACAVLTEAVAGEE